MCEARVACREVNDDTVAHNTMTKKAVTLVVPKNTPKENGRKKWKKSSEGFACAKCGKTYTQKRNLKRHMVTHDPNPQTFVCTYDDCGREFLRRDDYSDHCKLHTGSGLLKCKQCPKSFARSSDLKLHVRRHNQDMRYSCEICGKGFVRRCDRNAHEQRKHASDTTGGDNDSKPPRAPMQPASSHATPAGGFASSMIDGSANGFIRNTTSPGGAEVMPSEFEMYSSVPGGAPIMAPVAPMSQPPMPVSSASSVFMTSVPMWGLSQMDYFSTQMCPWSDCPCGLDCECKPSCSCGRVPKNGNACNGSEWTGVLTGDD